MHPSMNLSYWQFFLDSPTETIKEQAGRLRSFADFRVGVNDDPNDWRNYPPTTLKAYKEARRLHTLGLLRGLRLGVLDIEQLDKTDRDFLRRFE
jgi:hypothetical protein